MELHAPSMWILIVSLLIAVITLHTYSIHQHLRIFGCHPRVHCAHAWQSDENIERCQTPGAMAECVQ